TGVTATLSSTTPGVSFPTAGPFPYSNIAAAGGVATNATPYIFTLGPAYTCGTPVDFVLTVNYTDPSVRSQQIRFTVDLATTIVVPTTTVDATTPPANAAYTTSMGTQTSRVSRSGEGSSCNLAKAYPGTIAGVSPRFDGYTFTATSTGCVTVSVTGASANPVFAVAYLGAFVPASIATNYLADLGLSPANGQTLSFAFKVNAGQQFTVIVSEVGAATTPAYILSVSGQPCTTCNFIATAAGVSISGRVTSASGVSVSNAVVMLSDQAGETRVTRTNAFGYFRIDNVQTGRAYTATVTARRNIFAPQLFQLNDELASLNFVASQ
ncbi:MAG: carboxypeptidase-like regulatory domain-containing protein, partial [Pyrinomonadaceae bacterium]